MTNPALQFVAEMARNVELLGSDLQLRQQTLAWIARANSHKYTYNFSWMGRPIIQFPQDVHAMQEVIWSVRPDLIIETGIAHGGSLVFSASMLAMLDYCDAVESGEMIDPRRPKRRVVGVDIDIRTHNRIAIEAHPMFNRISMIQGSSVAPETIERVIEAAAGCERILVCLDSNHTHAHVLAELEAYAPLVSPGSYCCVFDTLIEDMPSDMFTDRPWGKGDNPKTAVRQYLHLLENEGRASQDGTPLRFEIDDSIDHKLIISVAPDGYLRRVA